MKYYKLKKDLPTFKVGEEFYLNENGNLISVENEPLVVYPRKTLEKFPNILKDWFEEIDIGFYLADSGEIIKYDGEEDPHYLTHSTELDNETPFMADKTKVLIRARQKHIHTLKEEHEQLRKKLEDIDTAIKKEQDALSDMETLLEGETNESN